MKEFVVYPARWLVIGLMVLLIAVIGCSSGEKAETAAEGAASHGETAEKAVKDVKADVASLANPEQGIDPICKMEIDGSLVVEIDGKEYGFCSQHCADKFKENPEKYLTAAAEPEE
jgi:YHS domain-containing protein